MPNAVVHLLSALLSAPLVLAGPPAQVFAGPEPQARPPAASPEAPGAGAPEASAAPAPRSPLDRSARHRHTPGAAVWPLEPRPALARGFEPPVTKYAAGHRGVDLVGSSGQTVRAAVAGRVTFAGRLAGRGVVVVSHGSTRTTYEPVLAATRVGTLVAAGDELGALETFGSHCAPASCLHWGLIEGDTYLDPLSLVGAGPARLLPLLGTRTGTTRDERPVERIRLGACPSSEVRARSSTGAWARCLSHGRPPASRRWPR
ncbi:MAG TPA: M23 family metallopeptidase [Nocardioidaceae bacterium]|nr:M23 family metallopeptidase [Nocardioidaceae bacterium]